MNRRIISPSFVEDALSSLRANGFASAPLLAAAGLPDPVKESISIEEYGRLWAVMTAAAEDEFFCLGARPMRPGTFTLICHSVLHADSLERAIPRVLRFLNIVLDDPKAILKVRGGEARIFLTDAGDARVAFTYRTYWLNLMGLACWLVGRQIPLRRVDFACSVRRNRSEYSQFFGAPVHFDQENHRLTFDASYLKLPLIRSEEALKVFLKGAPANILVRFRHDGGYAVKIRSELRALDAAEWPNFDTMASHFELSPATLRRRLQSEGQSFLSIKDELRRARAQELLQVGSSRIVEIAEELGYSEPSAFHRAFLKWTDRSPAAYRAAIRASKDGGS